MKILIVEDEFASRKLLTSLLSEYGQCDTANDGLECVKAFRQALDDEAPYDLVCLDIMMPNMNGHQALNEIRKLEAERSVPPSSEAKVIMVTALNDPSTVVKAYYKGGVSAYLPKPIEIDTLLSILRDLGIVE